MAAAVVHVVTPSMTRLGGWVEVAPLSVLTVRAGAEPGAYFGTFHSLMSFGAYTDPFDSETRDTRGAGKCGWGTRSYVTPAVQFRAGPIVARVAGDVERWQTTVAGPYYYEPARDTLLKTSGDWLLNSTSVAMYQRDFASGGYLSGGVVHNLTRVFEAPDNQVQRLGVLAIREFASPHLRLPHLRITATAWRYLDDPSKRNQWGAAVAIGFRSVRPARGDGGSVNAVDDQGSAILLSIAMAACAWRVVARSP